MSEGAAPAKSSHGQQLTRQQKAAAVIVSLGTEKASQLYQYMDPEDVEQITLEVARLGYLDSETTEDVLNEYYQMCLTNKAVTEGGLRNTPGRCWKRPMAPRRPTACWKR